MSPVCRCGHSRDSHDDTSNGLFVPCVAHHCWCSDYVGLFEPRRADRVVAERAVIDAALRWHERSTRENTIELMVAVSRLREIRGEP